MRFSAEDDEFDEFQAASDVLVDRFTAWVTRHGTAADASDVPILLDWRYSYSDGVLDTWTCADVEEFLLGWCPRKLSVDPEDIDGLPGSVAAWVDFLAHEGLLGPGGDPPSRIREYCAGIASRFRKEMADPRNFGMAKSRSRAAICPCRRWSCPRASVRYGCHVLRRSPRPSATGTRCRRSGPLAQHCPPPGRKLTAKGNLRLADARELVTLLDTGDDPERGGFGTIRSADDLPALSTCVRLGLGAGAVRRHNGRLIGVARFAELDDVAAHEKVVRAAISEWMDGDGGDLFTAASTEATGHLFAMMLDGPVEAADAIDLARDVLAARFPLAAEAIDALVPAMITRITTFLTGIDLLDIDMVRCDDCATDHAMFDLTPAGVQHAVERARALGVEVALLPDPAEVSATELMAAIAVSGPGFAADVPVWLAAQPDAGAAIDELGAALVAPERDPAEVLLALTVLEELQLPDLPAAVHRGRTGAHEGLLLPWLVEHGQIDRATVEPEQLVNSVVDVVAVLIDVGNADDAVDMFPAAEALPLLREVWRLDHPRLAEVLELVGRKHPVKAVAKEARRSLMKLRSRAGQ